MIAVIVLGTLAVAGLAISGGDSDDALNTEPTDSSDDLTFGSLDDLIDAGAGFDTVNAGAGDDTVNAGAGKDVIYAGSGDDSVEGGGFHDIAYGEGGDDTLNGGDGIDVLFGGEGADVLEGGGRNDVLYGGNGADYLSGGLGDDELNGVNLSRDLTAEEVARFRDEENPAPVTDVFVSTAADGADTLIGGDGNDYLALGKGDTGNGGAGSDEFELVAGQEGDGVIIIEDYTFGEDGVQIIIDDGNGNEITPVRSDYTVERDDETGDALILERGEVIARLLGAGDTFSNDYLVVGRYI
ncbi:calcium-binding protein [Leisingera sp. ANG-Vp]|uniref:calcium-binding protein n=1 Tax=Leisingera sp. ANG-Vp TaxID=1577896 RepID=UPI00068E2EE3|nr:calcium-binding protein [Leisingera sp. ANG-Vp]